MKTRVNKTHPKSFVAFIVEAIEEAAPGQGEAVYWRALERFQAQAAAEMLDAEQRAFRRAMQGKPPPAEEQWTVDEPGAV